MKDTTTYPHLEIMTKGPALDESVVSIIGASGRRYVLFTVTETPVPVTVEQVKEDFAALEVHVLTEGYAPTFVKDRDYPMGYRLTMGEW